MYNKLDQDVIMRGVKYMLWKANRKRRFRGDWITIFKQDKAANRIGRKYTEGLQISFEELFLYAEFDINHSYFQLAIIAAAMKRMARQAGYNKWFEWILPISKAYDRVEAADDSRP